MIKHCTLSNGAEPQGEVGGHGLARVRGERKRADMNTSSRFLNLLENVDTGQFFYIRKNQFIR